MNLQLVRFLRIPTDNISQSLKEPTQTSYSQTQVLAPLHLNFYLSPPPPYYLIKKYSFEFNIIVSISLSILVSEVRISTLYERLNLCDNTVIK